MLTEELITKYKKMKSALELLEEKIDYYEDIITSTAVKIMLYKYEIIHTDPSSRWRLSRLKNSSTRITKDKLEFYDLDNDYLTCMPIHYLWTEDWKADFQAVRNAQDSKEQLNKTAAETKQRELDYQKYLELKKVFENEK